ncbi:MULTISPECIES: hypothetical protein [Alphaproteobacteria]|uniref:Uncharacterized protein n=2 Tax=Alphaproteobacteria TaxID=28211 RepID=A0A512HEY1_9HYPH|nr:MULTISPECIES: hypothetical protein [Alphaproteobacteria]GEO84015.1 hypothetical protein RNA01_09470 [Ciceribacter naphthalenivorans]GLR21107.1 hypothetical protein GCM10007920_08930 [Ciceribacter naphthalenivorans]GLT03963.1 hypothetical protein GCM10007926_08930 [Sphingomonas psychrolutea]
MVDPVKRISRTDPSAPTQIDSSLSISSEPDNAWIAARQSKITEGLLALEKAARDEIASRSQPEEDSKAVRERESRARHLGEPYGEAEEAEKPPEHPEFSGESDRIGTQNFDDDTPFGTRVVIL